MTAHLTTHILNTTSGTPAAGVAVTLRGASGEAIAEAVTDADGRAGLGPELLEPGTYALTFATGAYFAAHGTDCFYPSVTVDFTITGARHYHVPLLLSPFAYSTYRGS
ncbi:hydroxyisourate hydrolase [Microbacterium schleiferi]|uniref:hydroxyisourate hydrolase n=1 Tax=Microbacterium schleiferi TaxID=69362 RepID=UPI00311EB1A5